MSKSRINRALLLRNCEKARSEYYKADIARLQATVKKQPCSICGLPSVPGLKSGLGKCEWHWTAGNWGRQWALQTIGAEPLPPRLTR